MSNTIVRHCWMRGLFTASPKHILPAKARRNRGDISWTPVGQTIRVCVYITNFFGSYLFLSLCVASPRTPVGWRSALPSWFLANSWSQVQDLPMPLNGHPSVLDDEGEAPPSTAAIAVGLFRDNFFKLEPEQTKVTFKVRWQIDFYWRSRSK